MAIPNKEEEKLDQHPWSPYVVGGLLDLQLDEAIVIHAEILQVFEPFTLSSTMLVQIRNHAELPARVVLKAYDRRFAAQLRRDKRTSPWSCAVEQQYRRFVQTGDAAGFITELEEESDKEYGGKIRNMPRDVVHQEAFLQYEMRRTFMTEVQAYQCLLQYQGRHVPRFYGSVREVRVHRTGSGSGGRGFDEYADVQGILLEYIDGFRLTDLSTYCPQEQWQPVGEDAIHIVHCLNSAGVLNRDVRLRNYLVRKDTTGRLKPVMIDLGICMFRDEFEDEDDWRRTKQFFHEENAVGAALYRSLKPHFVYERSEYWKQLDDDFDDE